MIRVALATPEITKFSAVADATRSNGDAHPAFKRRAKFMPTLRVEEVGLELANAWSVDLLSFRYSNAKREESVEHEQNFQHVCHEAGYVND